MRARGILLGQRGPNSHDLKLTVGGVIITLRSPCGSRYGNTPGVASRGAGLIRRNACKLSWWDGASCSFWGFFTGYSSARILSKMLPDLFVTDLVRDLPQLFPPSGNQSPGT